MTEKYTPCQAKECSMKGEQFRIYLWSTQDQAFTFQHPVWLCGTHKKLTIGKLRKIAEELKG